MVYSPNPVQNVTSGVRVGPTAGGQDNHSEQVEASEECEGFSSSPDIDQFGDGQAEDATDDLGEDDGSVDGGGIGKGRVGVNGDIVLHARLEGEHEVAHPDPVYTSDGVDH